MKWWHWVLVVLAVLSAVILVLHFTGYLSVITGYIFGMGTPPAESSAVDDSATGTGETSASGEVGAE